MTRIYKIEQGTMFQGTVEHFQDCFFSNADHESIMGWCFDHDYQLEWWDE